MNGTRAVDEEMTDRVRATARELHYSPSPLARSLVLGRTTSQNGYHVLVADSSESVPDDLVLAQQTRRRCDGLVLVAPRMPEAVLNRLGQSLEPVVLVNREPDGTGTPVVTADTGSG